MFKRHGVYYLLAGLGCCACRGGSNVVVYTAPSPLGPWALQGDVGSNSTGGHVFDAHSPWNYVTRAQGSKVLPLRWADGSTQFLWLGNAWVTAGPEVGYARNADLLYWTLLDFNATGGVEQLVRADSVTLDLAAWVPPAPRSAPWTGPGLQ